MGMFIQFDQVFLHFKDWSFIIFFKFIKSGYLLSKTLNRTWRKTMPMCITSLLGENLFLHPFLGIFKREEGYMKEL